MVELQGLYLQVHCAPSLFMGVKLDHLNEIKRLIVVFGNESKVSNKLYDTAGLPVMSAYSRHLHRSINNPTYL